ncbi:MAG: PEGA domain-containing protein [Sandaracinaceae bacterium]|nr:PEGA domain-containing protein [Sandaracinaceae bacterium]
MRRVIPLALLAIACSAVARAQDPGPEDDARALEARGHFEEGRSLAAARRFGEAAQAFERSFALSERPSTRFNLAVCLFALERYVAASDALERFLAMEGADDDPASAADARRMLAHARARLARLIVEVEPADATVTVDGAPLEGGAVRERAIDPGTRTVRASAPHRATAVLELTVAPGGELRRAIALESARVPARLEITVEPRRDAVIVVDGREVGTGEVTLSLDAGAHEVRVLAPSTDPIVRSVELAWNERLRVDVVRPAAPAPLYEDPVFWGAVAGCLFGAAAIAVIATLLAEPPAPSGGSTGAVLRPSGAGLTFP